jgi:hypothetical protein
MGGGLILAGIKTGHRQQTYAEIGTSPPRALLRLNGGGRQLGQSQFRCLSRSEREARGP